MNEKITIKAVTYDVLELSGVETLEAITLSQKLKAQILSKSKSDDYNPELVEVLSEFSVLSFYCLKNEGKKAFSSPLEVLQTLSIDDLCDVYDAYSALRKDKNFEYDEFSFNEGYPQQEKTNEGGMA